MGKLKAMTERRKAEKDYWENYRERHQHPVNNVLHFVGIPLIAISVVILFFRWRLGLALFALGWILQFLGHAIEGKAPAFFSSPRYFLVGPLFFLKKLSSRSKKADPSAKRDT